MNRSARLVLCVVLSVASSWVSAQQTPRGLHVGYVYPAGGQRGTSFEAVIGGQFLTGLSAVDLTGSGVRMEIRELVQPITTKELNDLRIEADELLARRSVVKNDFRALEAFRSFKNAKSVKVDEREEAAELEALKKKYAGASWSADDESKLLALRKKLSGAVRRPANPAIGELAIVQVTIDQDAALGAREVRVLSPNGLSNPLVFHVGPFPEFTSAAVKTITEQLSTLQKSGPAPKGRGTAELSAITLPTVVNGQMMPGKTDRYRFTARKGEQLVVVASARELVPYIADAVPGWFQAALAIYDERGRELAYDDDFQFNPDPVVYCRIPADGEYVVEIKDAIYRGREDFVYRITLGQIPFVTSIFPLGGRAGEKTAVELLGWNLPESHITVSVGAQDQGVRTLDRAADWISNHIPFAVDSLPESLEAVANDDLEHAPLVTLPQIINGRIERPDDVDIVAFDGKAGEWFVAEVLARRLNSPVDSVLKLIDASGAVLATNDDFEDKGAGLTTHQADSQIQVQLPADGRYRLQIADMQHQGGPEYGYRLRMGPPRPDFELRVAPSSIAARAGATTQLTVFAVRKDGFAGEIHLSLDNPPTGFRLGGGVIPGDQDQGRMTVTAPAFGPAGIQSLRLIGRATVAGQEVVREVIPAEDMMQAFAYRHLVPSQQLHALIGGKELARDLLKVATDRPIHLPVGGIGKVQIQAPRYLPLDKLTWRLSDSPEGITIQKVAKNASGLEVQLACDKDKWEPGKTGKLILAVSTKGTSFGKRELQLPAISFEVVP